MGWGQSLAEARVALRSATGFLTSLGGSSTPDPSALRFFPLVGACIGVAVGVVWVVADALFGHLVGAGLALGAEAALTGGLHLDGLADCGDGLLAPLGRSKRLDAMADPSLGAFGAVTLVVVVGLRWAALVTLGPSVWLLGALWTASRTLMAASALVLRYARGDGGIASAFFSPGVRPLPIGISGGLGALGLSLAWHPLGGVVSVVGGVLCGMAVLALAQRRIGGFTGDVLGAAGVVAETAGLVIATGRFW